ncbi:phosphoribosylanthranilate isomerase [Siphonobacter aquaeclarae]|jgi:phosphoribosylanthranilate isomerase|uniref:N-(5'-phosphoribosyl)anthranilate isomerase n=1 Tax=Siphonobacter aquaeclarae TaxID=563176 RepID=A0A1G9VLX7_9BACT|nr:phosphoribosylanthranilate isomerase [Siphonobacter aquaeclarae]MBO9636820.1 phosphoribosylanthranilate isomerase [Siphonobacter aquaeclarae]SDM73179.1 phosphoribosylanthranilate isomerase [Siphonobacter aquaeclarae]
MRIKVCGMKEAENIRELLDLQPDYLGFIFFEKSPRYVGESFDPEIIREIPRSVRKVGVFVNASIDQVIRTVKKYALDYVQLHGEETPDFCRSLQFKGVNIIKAFRVDDTFNFSQLNNYKPVCDYFLFDTKASQYGGTGIAFDWALLERYDNEKPFFLSGGIGPEDAEVILDLKERTGLKIHAVDINSKFEIEPGLKDIALVRDFIERLKAEEIEA